MRIEFSAVIVNIIVDVELRCRERRRNVDMTDRTVQNLQLGQDEGTLLISWDGSER